MYYLSLYTKTHQPKESLLLLCPAGREELKSNHKMDVMLQETPLIGTMRSEAKSSSALCGTCRWRLLQELNIPWNLPWDAVWGVSCYGRRWAEKSLFWPLQQQSFSTKGTVTLACWHQVTLISIFQSPKGQMTHEVFHVEKKSLRKKQK